MAKAFKKAAATMETSMGTVNLPIEEVKDKAGPELPPPAVLSPEQKAKQEIARFDIARTWIAEKKKAYLKLKIKGAEDKDGYKVVHAAWQVIRNKRLAVAKKKDEIKADYLIITRAVDKENNELTALLKEIEEPLGAELDRIDNLQKEEDARKEREAQERLQARVVELIANGMKFTGSYYGIGETISMDVVTLKALTDEDYKKFFERVAQENKLLLQEAENKRIADEKEKERLQQQKEEQEKERLRLEEQKKEMERQQQELENQKKEILKQRTQSRAVQLEGLGMQYKYNLFAWVYEAPDHGRVTFPKDWAETLGPQDWEMWMVTGTKEIEELKEKQAATDKQRAELKAAEEKKLQAQAEAKKLKEQRFDNRCQLLRVTFQMEAQAKFFSRQFKFDLEPLAISKAVIMDADDEQWAKDFAAAQESYKGQIAKESELQDAAIKKQEETRKAALSDAQRVREWVTAWIAAGEKKPTIENPEIFRAWQKFDEGVADLAADMLDGMDMYEKD
jgi:hypothetical protein